MTNTPVRATAEGMPANDRSVAHEIIDAEDELSKARQLVELIFMASESLGERNHTGAISTACEIIDTIMIDVRDRLDAARERLRSVEAQP